MSGLRMPQLDNDDIICCLLISVIDVIRRRTSEKYAVVIIDKIMKKLKEKHVFLKHVSIKNMQYSEVADFIDIKPDINYVDMDLPV